MISSRNSCIFGGQGETLRDSEKSSKFPFFFFLNQICSESSTKCYPPPAERGKKNYTPPLPRLKDKSWIQLKRCRLQLCLIKHELDIIVHILENWLFSIVVSLQKCIAHFYCSREFEVIRFKHFRKPVSIFHIIDQKMVFKGIVVNPTLPSLHRG